MLGGKQVTPYVVVLLVLVSQVNPKFFLKYNRIYVGTPSADDEGTMVRRSVTPHQCRLRDITYSAPMYVDVEYTRDNKLVRKRKLCIGRLPIMLRSKR